jgi:hypothetical protein
MNDPQIDLVLTDDWELRGDGSGDMRAMQFATIRELVSIYNRFGLKGTFMAEVMQQVQHRRMAQEHPKLAVLAKEWEATLQSVHAQGHDVQMHLHLHWSGACFEGEKWLLRSPWGVGDYSAAELRGMLENAKAYLEELLRPVNPGYRCCAFRAGSYLAAPSDHLLPTLAGLGIVTDVSVVPGWHLDTRFLGQRLFVDYRKVDEPYLPYYPAPGDFRRKGPRGPVHCVPTHSFQFGLIRKVQRRIMNTLGVGRKELRQPSAVPPPGAGGNVYNRRAQAPGAAEPRWSSKLRGLMAPALRVSDLSEISFWEAKLMIEDIRRKARRSCWKRVPVVITNHTKSIGDFGPIRQFAEYVAAAKDIRVLTLREVSDHLSAGRYPLDSVERSGRPGSNGPSASDN